MSPPGGRLAQVVELRTWWDRQSCCWVTPSTSDARTRLRGERVVWLPQAAEHGPAAALVHAARTARRLWRTEAFDVVVAGGGAVSLPFLWLGRRHGARTVFLEAGERVVSRSLSGRLAYRLSDLFLVQWPEQQALYPRAHVVGGLL